MSSQRYSPDFKDEAVRQIIERGYSVAEVSQRLGASSHRLYARVKAVTLGNAEQNTAELVEVKTLYGWVKRYGDEPVHFAHISTINRRGFVDCGAQSSAMGV